MDQKCVLDHAVVEVPAEPFPAGPTFRVETITDYSSFLDLEPVWDRLVEEAGIDHPFLTHEWVRVWWECFGAGNQLHILVVTAGGKPVAIAPLMLTHVWMYGCRVRRLQFISNVHTQRADVIISRWPQEAYQAIWECLANQMAQWDVLKLSQVPSGSLTLEELPRLAAEKGFHIGFWGPISSPYLPLRGTWDSYYESLDSKHRSNLRNRMKRLSQLGQVGLEEVSSGEHLDSGLEEGLRIEAAAWKGKAGTAICCCPELHRFYTRFARIAAQRGWLRLQFLTVNGRRIAFHYSLRYKNSLFLLKPGYDPDYAPYSPSNLLCSLVLRDAFKEGLSNYEFLGTADEWKLRWTGATKPHSWLFIFSNALRARILYAAKFQIAPQLKRLCMDSRNSVPGLPMHATSDEHITAAQGDVTGITGHFENFSRSNHGRAMEPPFRTTGYRTGVPAAPKFRMKFLSLFLVALATLSFLYAAAVLVVDPRGDFGTAVFPVVELDARTEKMQLFEQYIGTMHPDGLILGSSRAMKIRPGTLDAALGQHFFNFSVDNARADDYLAIYRWVCQHNVRLKSLILSLDVEALHNDDQPDPGLTRNEALFKALEQGALPSDGSPTQRSSLSATLQSMRLYRSMFTITYLDDTVRSIRLFLQPQSRPLPLLEFEHDGYLRYRLWESQRAAGTFQFDHDMERCLYKYVTRFQGMTALSSKRTAYLRQLIDDAQANGTKVVIWLTSLHPMTERHLATSTPYITLLNATRDSLASLRQDTGVPTFDFSVPAHYNGTPDGWYDCAHIDETNAERVTTLLAGALR
jgi:CelD/BcsL family acetyltransferase involved in cellulose biosynthesis